MVFGLWKDLKKGFNGMNDFFIETKVLNESGVEAAISGLSLSYKIRYERAVEVSNKIYKNDFGENKFLEQMMIWIKVRAPRYWWAEADTYRLSTKQSESTMHTLIKKLSTLDDEDKKVSWIYDNIECADMSIGYLNELIEIVKQNNIVKFKRKLTEGFLQTRVWMFSYKEFRNIVRQRKNHKFPHWGKFIDDVLGQLKHPEYFYDLK